MTKPSIWVCLGNIPETYVADAMPPSWREGTPGMLPAGKRRSSRVLSFFLDNGWVAAILSAVVAIGIIVAIVLAGRGEGPVPPVGTVPESETEEETVIPYTLAYTPLGNGTCSVRIVGNPENDRDYDVVIPETSPDGDTVVEVAERQFDHLVPHIMSVEFYEEEILAPLEAYYGLTLEEAEQITTDQSNPQFESAFYLRKLTFFFTLRNIDEIPEEDYRQYLIKRYPELTISEFYLMEEFTSTSLCVELAIEFARAGIMPADILRGYAEVDKICGYAEGTSAEKYAPRVHQAISYGGHIRSVTLPDTVKRIGDMAFAGCDQLENIHFGNGLEVLGSGALVECKNLNELHIPDSLREIRATPDDLCLLEITSDFSIYVTNPTVLWRCEWTNLFQLDFNHFHFNIYVHDQPLTELTLPEGITHMYRLEAERDAALPPVDGVRVVYTEIINLLCLNRSQWLNLTIPTSMVHCELPSNMHFRYLGTMDEWKSVEKNGFDSFVDCTDGHYDYRDP